VLTADLWCTKSLTECMTLEFAALKHTKGALLVSVLIAFTNKTKDHTAAAPLYAGWHPYSDCFLRAVFMKGRSTHSFSAVGWSTVPRRICTNSDSTKQMRIALTEKAAKLLRSNN
jgi:hypothetical protein